MASIPWTTLFPGAQDVVGIQQPDLAVGDDVLDTHPEAMRDKLQALAILVGDNNSLPLGSVRDTLNLVGIAKVRTTEGGGTTLTVGSIADGETPIRSGANLIGTPGVSGVYTPFILNTTPKAATFTAVVGEMHLLNLSGGGFTANLPAVATAGRIAFLITTPGGQLTIDPAGAETINGKATIKVNTGTTTIESDGTEWHTIQRTGKSTNRLDPAQITANQDPYNPTDWDRLVTHLYIDSDASRTLNGFDESSFVDEDEVTIVNDGGFDIVIAHDSSTTLADRVLVDGSADFTLGPNQAAKLLRDGTANRWRLYAISAGSGGGGGIAIISPAQITASQNDYAPTDWATASHVRLDADAAWDITGVDAAATLVQKKLINVGSFNLTLKHQDASSVAANRFLNFTGADIILQPDDSIDIFIDVTTGRVRAGV